MNAIANKDTKTITIENLTDTDFKVIRKFIIKKIFGSLKKFNTAIKISNKN